MGSPAEILYLECELCELPRRGFAPGCPFCGHAGGERHLEGIPADFGRRLVADGRWEVAAEYLESEVAAGRETPGGSLLMAWIALISNDLRAVETWSHESLRQDKEQAGPHLLRGLVFERSQRWEEAVAEYLAGLSFRPEPDRQTLIRERLSYCESQIPEW